MSNTYYQRFQVDLTEVDIQIYNKLNRKHTLSVTTKVIQQYILTRGPYQGNELPLRLPRAVQITVQTKNDLR